APPNRGVSSWSTIGRPEAVRPTTAERSSVSFAEGRPQAARPAVRDSAVAPRVKRRRESGVRDSMRGLLRRCWISVIRMTGHGKDRRSGRRSAVERYQGDALDEVALED